MGSDPTFEMTPERLAEFCNEVPMAAVASLRRSGAPFVVPLGYRYDNGVVYIAIREGRSGVTRLRRDGRVSVSLFDHAFPPSWVVMEGVAREVPDPDHRIKRSIITPFISRQGMDVDDYLEFWTSGRGRAVFEIPVDKLVSMDGRSMQGFSSLQQLRQSYDEMLGQHTG